MNGKNLKEKLRKLGKSQKEIADLLEVTPQSLVSIFNASDVRSGTIERLSQVLKLPLSFFYDIQATDANNTSLNNKNSNDYNESEDTIEIKDKVSFLSELLKEKERTIQILLSQDDSHIT